jgi:hypothetical protein
MVIPGPKKPKDLDSFLRPLVDELLELGRGVESVDGDTRSTFSLRAHITIVTGMRRSAVVSQCNTDS